MVIRWAGTGRNKLKGAYGIEWSSDGQELGEKGREYGGTSVRYKYLVR